MALFAVFCTGGILAGLLLLRRNPVLPLAAGLPAIPDFSIIVPARDEEANLLRLLNSLRGSGARPAEVIVVDDDSSDGTEAVAAGNGATVLPSMKLPPGWTGKTWACQQGALAATSEILFFLDADTYFAPDGLARILAHFRALPRESALSILPFHAMRKPYEQLSLFFNMLMAAGAGGTSGFDRPKLFGQSLLIRRELYFRAGGHGAVRRHVLENLFLAQRVRAAGGSPQTLFGAGTLTIQMFPRNLPQLFEGWQKGFAEGAGATSPVVLILSVYWLAAAALVCLGWFAGGVAPRPLALALYLAFVLQIGWQSRRLGEYRLLAALFYPLPLAFYFAVFGRSLWLRLGGRGASWKGRRL